MPLSRKFADDSSDSVVLRWCFNVSADRLWNVLTGCQTLPLWLGTHRAGNLAVGSTVKIEHAEGDICESLIERIDPATALEMSWKFPEESESKVSWILRSVPIGAELVLTHSNISVDVATYLAGWETHLTYLESVLLGAPRSMDQFWDLYREIYESLGDSPAPLP